MTFSVCFIHGLGDDEARFSHFADDLRDSGLPCSTLRLPDCHSTAPRPNVTQLLANEIELFFSGQSPDVRKAVVAHSLGGLLALSDNRIRSIVDKFVLVEPSIRDADYSFFQILLNLPHGQRIEQFRSMLAERNSEIPSNYIDKLQQWSEESITCYCKLATNLIPNAVNYMDEVREKTTILFGRKSWGLEKNCDNNNRNGATLCEFMQSGHWPFVTEKNKFQQFLVDVLIM